MEKLYNEKGQVAVAVSEGFGAGWSTWNDVNPMDARFNELFLQGKHVDAVKLCEDLGLGYSNGGRKVILHWVDPGTNFYISEYDGSEDLIDDSAMRFTA